MPRPCINLGVLPDELYIQSEPWPHIGRPAKHDLSTWTVTDDWPEHVPITDAELDVFEAWFGDLCDGPRVGQDGAKADQDRRWRLSTRPSPRDGPARRGRRKGSPHHGLEK